jgi:hypothetical protein
MTSVSLPRIRLVRSIDAGGFLESFLVATVGSILGLRLYLHLANYPQVGGHGLHIAHMLWGGLLMMVALVLVLAFLGRKMQRIAAIVGGIGFGLFIDELGKFITSDNDYFYQPTIAIIYVILVLLFLAFRAIEREQTMSDVEYLANALDMIKEALFDRVAMDQRDHALRLLQQVRSDSRLTGVINQALQLVECVPPAPPGVLARTVARLRAIYRQVVEYRWFRRLVVGLFVLQAIGFVATAVGTVITDPNFTFRDPNISIHDVGDLFGSTLASLMTIIGAVRLRWSRIDAYTWFRRSQFVSIFIIQVFAFYTEQLAALAQLALDVLLLMVLDYMIREERDAQAAAPACEPEPAAATAQAVTSS